MVEIEIRTFAPDDADGVISVILPIQREEFGIDMLIRIVGPVEFNPENPVH